MRRSIHVLLAAGITGALASSSAMAAEPGPTCEASKLGTSAKYAQCRLKADSKAVKKGVPVDYSKCSLDKFASAEGKAGMGVCPTEGDQSTVTDYLDDCTSRAALWLAGGGGLPDTCAADLSTCEGDLSGCEGELSTCEGDLATCSAIPRLPATGQTTCSNGAGTVVACAGTGQDGDVLAGVGRSFTDNGNGTITDHATGLMWEKLGDDGSIHDKDNQYTWQNAFGVKIAALNTANFGGYSDWRVPNYYELQTIINAENPPSFPPFSSGCTGGCSSASCSCTVGDNYWTSTTSEGTTRSQAYTVRFTTGLGVIMGKGSATYMRAVRGGGSDPGGCTAAELALAENDLAICTSDCVSAVRAPVRTGQTTSYGAGTDGDLEKGALRSFTDNGDGTITDNTTGLMWEKKSDDGSIHDKDNTYTWSTASNLMNGSVATTFLATLNGGGGFAGYTDWRIPNVHELESLRNLETSSPAVYPQFNDSCTGGCTVTTCSCTQSDFHWSSTTSQNGPTNAWIVFFSGGSTGALSKTSGVYVRAVRAGS